MIATRPTTRGVLPERGSIQRASASTVTEPSSLMCSNELVSPSFQGSLFLGANSCFEGEIQSDDLAARAGYVCSFPGCSQPTSGPGAEARLTAGGLGEARRRSRTGGSYGSAHDPRLLFGLGAVDAAGAVTVVWPDGSRQRWNGLGEY